MKKRTIYALMSAIALTGAVGFSGCSTSDEVLRNENGEEINPTYDPVAKTVNTDLVLSFSNGSSANSGTRMTAGNVQADGSFNGIKDIQLLPFGAAVETSSTPTSASIISSTTVLNTTMPEHIKTATNSHFYHFINVVVPTETTHFLFYGLQNKAATDVATKFQYGYLTPPAAFTGAASTFNFTPEAIYDGTANSTCTDIIAYLTAIAGANVTLTPGDETTTKQWGTVTEGDNATLHALYQKFTGLKSGSSAAVRKVVADLFNSLYANSLTTIGADIITKINTEAVADAVNGTITFTKEGSKLIQSDANDYPGNVNLPDGAAVIKWTTADNGVKTPSVPVTEDYTTMNATNPVNFVYPASLYYFANTEIKTSNSIKDKEYDSQSTWGGVTGTYTGSSVTESTRDIALVNEIRYAVGQLLLQIKANGIDGAADGTYVGQKVLKDKLGREVPLVNSTSSSFPITGIIIGAQKGVDFKFEPISTNPEFTIYDKDVSGSVKISTETADNNYTLALQTGVNQHISIAIELVNNSGVDFQGVDGVVFNGSKFYLAAELNPESGTVTGNRVFCQHYATTVSLSIKSNTTNTGTADDPNYPDGLGAAYNTVPDLGTPALRLGFSVNLTWDPGITFEQEL